MLQCRISVESYNFVCYAGMYLFCTEYNFVACVQTVADLITAAEWAAEFRCLQPLEVLNFDILLAWRFWGQLYQFFCGELVYLPGWQRSFIWGTFFKCEINSFNKQGEDVHVYQVCAFFKHCFAVSMSKFRNSIRHKGLFSGYKLRRGPRYSFNNLEIKL